MEIGKIIPAISALAVGAAAVGVGTAFKKKNICPRCEIKKLLAGTQVHLTGSGSYNNGAAMTPPMGWSSWNTFRNNINEDIIKETALAMKQSGLLEAGYNYVNLDDCWHSSIRDENGRLQGDLSTFPSGIPALVKEINDLGMKVGIYSSNGTLTCEDLPASLGNERIDAETFAEWGIEYFKYDFCHNVPISTKAPLIDKIEIAGTALPENLILEAESGELYGTAKLFEDEKGSYIGRLDAGTGSVRFSFVNVPEDGEYILTVIVRKAEETAKYAVVTVNDDKKYPIDFPPTKAWSNQGRQQTKVFLHKGDNTLEIKNPIGSKMDSAAAQYMKMGEELKRATKLYAEKNGVPEKPIVFSICEWGQNQPWKWGNQAGNLWRTTGDIRAAWTSVVAIYEATVRLADHAGPGGWNDPDMLEVGNGSLTYDENKAHFSLWCMMASPLILGNDIRTLVKDGKPDGNSKVLEIVTNRDMIAIDQDAKGMQCRRIKTDALHDILVKPLTGGEVAVCFFNKGRTVKNMTVRMQDIVNLTYVDTRKAEKYSCTELWDKTTVLTADSVSAEVPPHGVKVFRIKAV